MIERKKTFVLVWDVPIRVFHWLLAMCFLGAWLTSESERWQLLHLAFGNSMAILIAFRLVWGLVGTRYARFTQFVKGPSAALRYLRSIFSVKPQHFVGHNPAGAFAFLAVMGMTALVVASGYVSYHEIGGKWLSEVHEWLAGAMLALIGVHIAAALLTSVLHGENLVRAMVTGKKTAEPDQGIERSWSGVAILLLLSVGLFWWALLTQRLPFML